VTVIVKRHANRRAAAPSDDLLAHLERLPAFLTVDLAAGAAVATILHPRVDRVGVGVGDAQATASLRPTRIAGAPGIDAPASQPCGPSSCASYQTAGNRLISKCGSLASIAVPVAVREGATTQLFEAADAGTTGCPSTSAGTSGSSMRRPSVSVVSKPAMRPPNSSSRTATGTPALSNCTSQRSALPCVCASPT
jgi:hypothetical protein